MNRIIFDIGATRTRVACATDTGVEQVLHAPTPEVPSEGLLVLQQLIQGLGGEIEGITGGIAAIIGGGGSIVRSTNLPRWSGYAFATELASVYGVPVHVMNDAELAGLGETMYGAGKGMHSVAYIGIGTGVGTSHILGGAIVPESSCGVVRDRVIRLHDGARLEELVGGNSIRTRYGVLPEALTRDVWDMLTPMLAEGISNAIKEWSPNTVVLGGSLMNEANGFRLEEVRSACGDVGVRIEKAALGDNSGLYGAKAIGETETPAA